MVCSVSCSISFIFIVGMIYFYNMTSHNKVVKEYKSRFPPELQKLYEKISSERMSISYYGYFLGFILSMVILFYNIRLKKNKLSNSSLVCIVVSTSFLTNYFYYTLSPKSDWMLNHIEDPALVKAWLQMYRVMQFNYHMGMVLGIIAVGILAFAFRC
jgi:uncharacterized membrane protein YkgB